MAFESLFANYDRLVLFDTETTGLQFSRDEIIEFAAVVVELKEGSEAAAVAFAEELAAQFGLSVENKSKFRRAQMLAKGE